MKGGRDEKEDVNEDNLKGQCLEIFRLNFFHQSAPSGPIRGTLAEFHILTYFRGVMVL